MGTSIIPQGCRFVKGDHPHACGDKILTGWVKFPPLGSSPRVWGQGQIKSFTLIPTGIIPTRVGTSIKKCISYFSGQDHPHACGDKARTRTCYRAGNGSSPRVWGQGSLGAGKIPLFGIIPTRVGTRTFDVPISPAV